MSHRLLTWRAWKASLVPIMLYSLVLTLGWFLEQKEPSGPCTPGPGVMICFLLIPILNTGMLVITARHSWKEKVFGTDLLVNIIVFFAWLLLFLFGVF